MKITARGWGRDMGTKVIADYDLGDLSISRDPNRRVSFGSAGFFKSWSSVFFSWGKRLQLTGDYRVEIEFSNADILQLFKARFGKELDDWLVDDEGFTISPDLTKRVLRTVKLSDVTLGDLAAMNTTSSEEPATAEKLVESAKVMPIRRRP
jgi:hypothetical protein